LRRVPSLAFEPCRMAGAGICAADDERELLISRRNFFLCGAVALLPLLTLLPTTDPYDQFLNTIRERLIKLARDGHMVERLEIFPPQDGQRVVNVWCENASEPITWSERYNVR
jgi:hypothetical protein